MSSKKELTKDSDWRLICETCSKDLGAFNPKDEEQKGHLGHRHHIIPNPESPRWK